MASRLLSRHQMNTRRHFSAFRMVLADIVALVASLALAACADGRQPPGNHQAIGNIDGGIEGGTPTMSNGGDGSVPDGSNSCTGDFRTWRYETPGCGASKPARVCGAAFDAGCLSGYICTCAGKWEYACERVSKEPWSYVVPQDQVVQGKEPPLGGPCDPTVVPDGGVR
jgi:hypothetical protein